MSTASLARVLDPAQLEVLLRTRPDIRMLDVRTWREYGAAHIRGSYNVPLDHLGEHAAEIRATVNEPVVLICQAGGRAQLAEEALRSAGMDNVHLLDGGLGRWIAEGRPVDRGRVGVSLERQVRVVAGALAAAGGVLAVLVSAWFGLLPAAIGAGLVYAGITDRCGMALLLTRLPCNRSATCDVQGMISALAQRAS
jgi:rhodanese-related sulfurtransferase